MNIVGQFLVQESFTLTGVGFTIVGQLIDGDVKRDNLITINTGSSTVTLTIKYIDYPRDISVNESRRGLRFADEKDDQNASLSGVKVPEQQVAVWTK